MSDLSFPYAGCVTNDSMCRAPYGEAAAGRRRLRGDRLLYCSGGWSALASDDARAVGGHVVRRGLARGLNAAPATGTMRFSKTARLLGNLRFGLCALISLGSVGCADPRISLEEFIAANLEVVSIPTSQPATRSAEDWAKRAFVPEHVGPSDVLAVALTGLTGDTTTEIFQVRVNREGEISLPIAGKVKVGGLELEDVEQTIWERYVPAIVRTLSVHVEVVSYAPTDVIVTGAVAVPGLTSLRRNERDLLHAVAQAGGVSFQASGRIFLRRLRTSAEDVSIDLLAPNDLDRVFSLEPLESGDLIIVEAARPNTIFVGGLVNVPGPQLYAAGTEMNLLQTLAAAGGVREDVFPRDATLIRRMPDGSDAQVKIDLDRLRKGVEPNIVLAAGDILWVPETVGTRIMDFVNRNIFFRAGFTASYNVTGNATGVEFLNRRAAQSANLTNATGGTTLQNRVDPLGFLVPRN